MLSYYLTYEYRKVQDLKLDQQFLKGKIYVLYENKQSEQTSQTFSTLESNWILPVTLILFPCRSEMTTISCSFKLIHVCLRSVPFTVSLVVVILRPRWSVLLRYSIFPSGEERFQ